MSDEQKPPEGGVTSILDGGEANASLPTWQEQLPQELKGHEAFNGVSDVHALARENIDLKSKAGNVGDLVKIPGEGDSTEEHHAFWKRLGRPETASEYEITKDDVADGFIPDEQAVNKLKEIMFKAGVTKQAAKDFVKDFSTDIMAASSQRNEELRSQRQEELTKLREQEWRGQYDQNINLAQKGWRWLMEEGLREKVIDSGLSEDPSWLKAMHRLGRQLGEETILQGAPTPPPAEPTREYPNSPEMYGENKNSTVYQGEGQTVRRFAGTANSAQGVEAVSPNVRRTPAGRRPR